MFNSKTQQVQGKAGNKHTEQLNSIVKSIHKVTGRLADSVGWVGMENRWVSKWHLDQTCSSISSNSTVKKQVGDIVEAEDLKASK